LKTLFAIVVLLLLSLAYIRVVAPNLPDPRSSGPSSNIPYIDFGDGNYLYIAGRLADGLVLYRDVLAPQPPLHLATGSLLIRLGRAVGGTIETQLLTVRVFSIALHIATMLLVFGIARTLFRRLGTALWAAGLYLFMPLGFWWSLGYQSEPLEMFFLIGSFLLIVQWRRWSLIAAGVLAALGMSTNMTAVPYVGWVTLFLLVRDWRRALQYAIPAAVGIGVVVAVGEVYSGGHYLENVFFNQVGTFPHPDLWRGAPPPGVPFRGLRTIFAYGIPKIMREGMDVLALEGLFIMAAIAGLLLYIRRREFVPAEADALQRRGPTVREGEEQPQRRGPTVREGPVQPEAAEKAPVAASAHAGEELAVEGEGTESGPLKRGLRTEEPTVEGEGEANESGPPMQESRTQRPPYERSFVAWYAIWSLLSICFVIKGATMDYIFTIGEPFVCLFAAYLFVDIGYRVFGRPAIVNERMPAPAAMGVILILGLMILFARPVFWILETVRNQTAFELNARDTRKIRFLIEENSKPGEAILGPPFYAFIAERKLVEEYSELFIWDIKFALEERVEHTSGPATRKVYAIAAALNKKQIPLIVHTYDKSNRRNPRPQQIFAVPGIHDAIMRNYVPLLPEPIESLNTLVNVFVRKEEAAATPLKPLP
jgi:hypothetical protein